jgi:hypothetical protein
MTISLNLSLNEKIGRACSRDSISVRNLVEARNDRIA